MRNFKLTLCYDGTRYKGWQRQGNTPDTIQEKMETLLGRILSQEIELAGSGRTDAGVHAAMQVCSFHGETSMDCAALLAEIRRYLPEDIGAISLEEAQPRFHARLNCREKTYIYRIWNSASPNVFQRRYMLSVPEALDIKAMTQAGELLCGTHDFSALCTKLSGKKSAIRTVKFILISREGGELDIRICADGFLYNMVRIIVGTLLEVGQGLRDARSMPDILASKSRGSAGPTAPARGLTLLEEKY